MASFALIFFPVGKSLIHSSGLPHLHIMVMMAMVMVMIMTKTTEASIIHQWCYSKQFMQINSFILTALGGRCHFYSDFTDEEREASEVK